MMVYYRFLSSIVPGVSQQFPRNVPEMSHDTNANLHAFHIFFLQEVEYGVDDVGPRMCEAFLFHKIGRVDYGGKEV
jgi:hypothetical protein